MANILSRLAESWPSPFVAREKVGEFSGGILHPRTMANHDSRGDGVPGKISIGRKVAYPVEALVEWMESRVQEEG